MITRISITCCLMISIIYGQPHYNAQQNFQFPDQYQNSRNPYQNQGNSIQRGNDSHLQHTQSNQTVQLSEAHQNGPYRQQVNQHMQAQYSGGRAGAWQNQGHSQGNQSMTSQNPPRYPQTADWNSGRQGAQYQNWNYGGQGGHHQGQNPGQQNPHNQNLDNGRQGYHQNLNSQPPLQQNWGPQNYNPYNQQQIPNNYNQHPLQMPHMGMGGAMNPGMLPIIDPDLPDGLDDLWEMKQKQRAVQHMMQTNPQLLAQAMAPAINPGHPYNGLNQDKPQGGPGHVKIRTRNENEQNVTRWGQHNQDVPYRSNFEAEPIQMKNLKNQGKEMPLRPSSLADISNKLAESRMTDKERKDLLGNTEAPINYRSRPQEHPFVQHQPVPETKTTIIKAGNIQYQTAAPPVDRSQWYRKRGQNSNVETTTTQPSPVWNVDHKASNLEYEKNANSRYRSRIQSTTTLPNYYNHNTGYGRNYQEGYAGMTSRQGNQSTTSLPNYYIQNTGYGRNYEERYAGMTSRQENQNLAHNYQQQSALPEERRQESELNSRTGQKSSWDPRQNPRTAEFVENPVSQQYRNQNYQRINQQLTGGNDDGPENQQYRQSARNLEPQQYLPNPQITESEREREKETENGRTSISMQYSTDYNPQPGNSQQNRNLLQEMIAERMRQRKITLTQNSTMPWAPVQTQQSNQLSNQRSRVTYRDPGTQDQSYRPMPWDKIQEGGQRMGQQQQRRTSNYDNDQNQRQPSSRETVIQTKNPENLPWDHIQEGGRQTMLPVREQGRQNQQQYYKQQPGTLTSNQNMHLLREVIDPMTAREKIYNNGTNNNTKIPAITGREVWTDPANQKEIEASRLTPSLLDKIIDSFLIGGGDEIETPYGKIEREEGGGFEVEGPLLRIILYELANQQPKEKRKSPEQLEHLRKLVGFDLSNLSKNTEKTTGSVTMETTTKPPHIKATNEKRQRMIWDSLPGFENPSTVAPTGSSSKTGRQIWDKMSPWDSVNTKPANGQNTGLQSPWEPVEPQNQFNPLFESKIRSNQQNSSMSVKETKLTSGNIQAGNIPMQVSTPSIPNNTKNPEEPPSTQFTHIVFEEPLQLNKTPPVAARMIMVPEDTKIKLNTSKVAKDDKDKSIQPVEPSDSPFGILFAIIAGIAVLAAPVFCVAWKVHKHYQEKKLKKIKEESDDFGKFEMEMMIAHELGKSDGTNSERNQGARKKTYFTSTKLEDNLHELQPLNSGGKISTNVIVHQANEIY